MNLSRQEADVLIQQGADAFRQGRLAEARQRLEAVAESGAANGVAWMLLAVVRRADRDPKGEEQAVDRLLEQEPQSVRGHIMKADCRGAAGDEPAAMHFYRMALRLGQGRQLPPEVNAEMTRSATVLRELEELGHTRRERLLKERGLPPEEWSPRFRHALDLAAGRRRQYFQEPTAFNYPELPQRQYFDPADFEWTGDIEAATSVIRDELVALLAERGTGDFRAYIAANEGSLRIDANKSLLDNKDWSALFLCENGRMAPEIVAKCPKTWAAVQKADLPAISGWGPTVMFSLLKTGARIAPHTGMFNSRLVCHLPLIVPPGCRFRVGNEVREWEEGKLLIFDDTIEHEAWNEGPEDRIILIFDIWRPELNDRERRELSTLFAN